MSDPKIEIDLSKLFDADVLKAAQKQYDHLGQIIERLTRKRSQIGKLIELAKDISEDDATPALAADSMTVPEPPRTRTRVRTRRRITLGDVPTWKGAILDVLARTERGLTHDETKAELMKTALADRMTRSDKGYYGAVSRLIEEDEIVRHKGRNYSKAAFAKFEADVAAGLVEDKEAPLSSQTSPVKEAIIAFLSERPHGAVPLTIIAHIRTLPEYNSDTAIYNLLSRMRKRGELVKRGRRDALPPRNDAAPSEHKSNGAASVTGGGPTPPIESRQARDLLG